LPFFERAANRFLPYFLRPIEAARAAGVYIRALTSPDDNMAAVFKYLTETSS